MIDWPSLLALRIPEGNAASVSINGTFMWQKPGYQSLYQRVEYLEVTDTEPYMVSDVIADNETGVEMGVLFTSYVDRTIIGSRSTSGNTRFYLPYLIASNGNVYYGYNAGGYVECTIEKNIEYVAQLNFLNSRTVSVSDIDGNVLGAKSLSGTLAQQTTPIGIFRQTRGYEGTNASRPGRLYYIKISQDTEVIREYLPCYRKSDGILGFYEKYTDQFLTNVGIGEFSKGADIEW